MSNYIALIRKDGVSDYSVDFPDFPGCVTAGVNLDDAKDMSKEVLELHVEGMLEEGIGMPNPSSLDMVMADTHNKKAVAFLVEVKARREKAVRVNVTFPESVLNRIDVKAKAKSLTRSAYLQEAALEYG